MDRYEIVGINISIDKGTTNINVDYAESENGKLAMYSDVEALQARVRELEEQVSNSIPKPVVQCISGPSSGGYTYSINGREFWTDFDGCDAEFWGAIGLEGGEDE